jgi:hypothetical protein
MNDFTKKHTTTRIRKLFESFKSQYGKELKPEVVCAVLEERLQKEIKAHIDRTLGDVGLKTLFDTVEILKKGEYKNSPPTITATKKKKATKKATKKKAASEKVAHP